MLAEEEYNIVYKYIRFITIDTWKSIQPEMAWADWVKLSLEISKHELHTTATGLIFDFEGAFLIAAFDYSPEFADELVKMFYVNENNNMQNKLKNGRENQIVTSVFGI